jgi:hypothetical protein
MKRSTITKIVVQRRPVIPALPLPRTLPAVVLAPPTFPPSHVPARAKVTVSPGIEAAIIPKATLVTAPIILIRIPKPSPAIPLGMKGIPVLA